MSGVEEGAVLRGAEALLERKACLHLGSEREREMSQEEMPRRGREGMHR